LSGKFRVTVGTVKPLTFWTSRQRGDVEGVGRAAGAPVEDEVAEGARQRSPSSNVGLPPRRGSDPRPAVVSRSTSSANFSVA